MTTFRWGSATDVGMVRENNQDSLLVADPLFAVADGVGGHQGGEVASATALEVLEGSFARSSDRESLLEAVRRANAKVWDKAQLNDDLRGMGTTLTAIARIDDGAPQGSVAVVNVGDSRAYLFRDNELRQVTTDHSLVEEMVRAGEISAEEAETHPRRNILTRALGVEPTVEVDIEVLETKNGDRILLCSDGLVREITDDQVAAILRRLRNPEEACKELVSQAKAHGGHDNITVVLVDVVTSNDTVTTDGAAKPRLDTVSRKSKRKASAREPLQRKFTFRMFLFFFAVAALIVIACGSVVWYARASYFVGLDGQVLTIYRGRPEPVLWFKPTVTERTNITTARVLPSRLPDLQKGVAQSSLDDAHKYVQNLTGEASDAMRASPLPILPPAPSPTTTTGLARTGPAVPTHP